MVMDKVAVRLHVSEDFFRCMCVLSAEDPPEDRGRALAVPCLRRDPSELGVTLEDGCGPVVYTLTRDGSKALLLASGSH